MAGGMAGVPAAIEIDGRPVWVYPLRVGDLAALCEEARASVLRAARASAGPSAAARTAAVQEALPAVLAIHIGNAEAMAQVFADPAMVARAVWLAVRPRSPGSVSAPGRDKVDPLPFEAVLELVSSDAASMANAFEAIVQVTPFLRRGAGAGGGSGGAGEASGG